MYVKKSDLWCYKLRLLLVMAWLKKWLTRFINIIWAESIVWKNVIKLFVLKLSWSSKKVDEDLMLIIKLFAKSLILLNYHFLHSLLLYILQYISLLIYQTFKKIVFGIYCLNSHVFFWYTCLNINFFF